MLYFDIPTSYNILFISILYGRFICNLNGQLWTHPKSVSKHLTTTECTRIFYF